MATGAIRVHGLKELDRAFAAISKDVRDDFVGELQEAAQPVALGARSRALTEIRNMPRTPEWAAMRIGVAKRNVSVWVAPQLRGGRNKRPNLAPLLLDAMESAAEENRDRIIGRIDDMLDRIADHHGF